MSDYIEYEVNLSDKELLTKEGITEIKIPKCQRISKTKCMVRIDKIIAAYLIDINSEMDLQITRWYNQSMINYLERLRERKRINAEKEFYANQSYGTETVYSIK